LKTSIWSGYLTLLCLRNPLSRRLCLSIKFGDDAVSRASIQNSAAGGVQGDVQSRLWLDEDLITAQYNRTPSPSPNLGEQPLVPVSNDLSSSSTPWTAVPTSWDTIEDVQPLNIPGSEGHFTSINNWTPSPNQAQQPLLQSLGSDYFFNSPTDNLATTQNNWTPSHNQVQQPLVPGSSEENLVTAHINVILPPHQGEQPVVQFILPQNVGGYSDATAPQPLDQKEEIRSVETPVQRHRRIKKENKSALQVEDLCLDVELAEKKKKMTEFSAEIRILSRLTMAGTDITQKVEGWINKVADAERKSQEEREAVMKTLKGDTKKRKALDDLLEKEVSAKKKRKAELDENVEKASKISNQMEQKLMQLLRY